MRAGPDLLGSLETVSENAGQQEETREDGEESPDLLAVKAEVAGARRSGRRPPHAYPETSAVASSTHHFCTNSNQAKNKY
jgi:hypothetical protein